VSLEGKIALITGADGPIGVATALRFAREGAVVVLNDIVSKHLERVATQVVEEEGGKTLIVLGDVTLPAHVERMVRETLEAYGRIDILVNNAGDNEEVALQGATLCVRAVAPGMCERRWGRIITTSRVSSLGDAAEVTAGAGRGAVIALTKALALEYARDGITVNCVAPGATMTNVLPEVKETILALIPMGRIAEPREVAAAHVFLAADDASYITGQVLYVDGGLSVETP
jgi:NAD(P)-dependent dehydrogenase (short-subunit alcohol dehydrogenase family)